MNRLVGLDLRGFKSIRAVTSDDLKLGPINVLIGANGAGKSNLISFFRLMAAMARGELQLHVAQEGGASGHFFDGPSRTDGVEAVAAFDLAGSPFTYECLWRYAADDKLVFAKERLAGEAQASLSGAQGIIFVPGNHETRLISVPTTPWTTRALELLRQFVVYQFHNTSQTARIRQRWSTSDGLQLKEDGGNLAPFLLRLRTQAQSAYARIVSTIQQVAPFFSDFVLQPEGDTILLRWRERGSDLLFAPHQASDGTLRAMALISLLLQPEDELPPILIFDEPELGLHPYAIELVAGLLRSASTRSQVIVATQSMALVDHFQPDEIIVANRVGRESKFKRLEEAELKDWLGEYALGELWEKNVLGGTPS